MIVRSFLHVLPGLCAGRGREQGAKGKPKLDCHGLSSKSVTGVRVRAPKPGTDAGGS